MEGYVTYQNVDGKAAFLLITEGEEEPIVITRDFSGTTMTHKGFYFTFPFSEKLEHREVYKFDYPFETAVEAMVNRREILVENEVVSSYYKEVAILGKKNLFTKKKMEYVVIRYPGETFLVFHVGTEEGNFILVKSAKDKRTRSCIKITEGEHFAEVILADGVYAEITGIALSIVVAQELPRTKEGIGEPERKYLSEYPEERRILDQTLSEDMG